MKKNNYNAPTVKVVSFKVEGGFVTSPDPTNLSIGRVPTRADNNGADGTQAFGFDYSFTGE